MKIWIHIVQTNILKLNYTYQFNQLNQELTNYTYQIKTRDMVNC